MKNRTLAAGLSVIIAASALTLGIAAPASAHTPRASATCEAVTVDATSYDGHKPAVGEPTIPNPGYVPAIPGTPAVGNPTVWVDNPDHVPAKDAVTKTEYLYKQLVTGKEKWLDKIDWNPGLGWYYTFETRQAEVSPAVPAVGEPKIEVANPDYKPAVPEVPAVGEPTIPNPDHTPASDAPNTVKVTVNGETVVSESFGTSFHRVVPFANKYQANEWTVEIVAWNDPQGYKGWTKTYSGTSTPCDLPIVPPGHNANGEATCGAWSITLYNQQGEYEQAQTASFVTYIDGKFADTYAVKGGEQQTITGTFPEDSGNHQIIVRTGPSQGDEFVFSLDVTSDCITPQPEDKVDSVVVKPTIPCDATVGTEVKTTANVTTTPYVYTDGEWVLGESKVTSIGAVYVVTAEDVKGLSCPVAPKPAVMKAAVQDDSILAQTGGEINPWLLIGGFTALLIGASSVLVARRKH